jgi:hypothetical protein
VPGILPVVFDLSELVSNPGLSSFMVPNGTIGTSVEVTSFTLDDAATQDAQFTVALEYDWVDTNLNTTNPNIGMTVTPSYGNNTLGTKANQGKSVSYNVALSNLNKKTATGMVKVILRPSTCLAFNATVYADSVKQKKIAGFDFDEELNEVTVYLRGLKASGTTVIQVPFT